MLYLYFPCRIHGAQYIYQAYNDESWLVNNFPYRTASYSWKGTKILTKTTSYDVMSIHTIDIKPGYVTLRASELPMIPNSVDIIPVTVEQQNKDPAAFSMRINHYASIHINRDDEYIAKRVIDQDHNQLLLDDKPIKFMTQCIDDYKKHRDSLIL